MKIRLKEETIHFILSVFKQFPEIEEVIIYGSRANGNYRAGSDIDFTLKGDLPNETIRSNIYQQLENLNTLYLFDVSVYKEIESESLLIYINRIGTVFYTKADALTQ